MICKLKRLELRLVNIYKRYLCMFIINKITFFFLRTIKIFLNSVLIKYLFLSSFIVTLIKVSKSNNK